MTPDQVVVKRQPGVAVRLRGKETPRYDRRRRWPPCLARPVRL